MIKLAQVRTQGREFFVQEEKFLDQMNDRQFVTWKSLMLLVAKIVCADSSLLLAVKKRNKPARSAFTHKT